MQDFDDIRPYRDEEVAGVLAGLLRDPQLLDFLARYRAPRAGTHFAWLMRPMIAMSLRKFVRDIGDVRGFQNLVERYVAQLLAETTVSFDYRGVSQLPRNEARLFVSNHRDIAGDSMLLDYALHLDGRSTVRIAIGDNLVQRKFATDLMRLNKGFFIKRTGDGAKEVYAGLLKSSRFIHESVATGESVWIAQAEGRAKDGMDVTDPAMIKMLGLAKRKRPLGEALRPLRLTPVSVSYEYDPCDEMKAREVLAADSGEVYTKQPGEDLVSLARGLGGFKGRVRVQVGAPLTLESDNPEHVAKELDRAIVAGIGLYPCNMVAMRLLARDGVEPYAACAGRIDDRWLKLDDKFFFERIAAVRADLKQSLLRIYANPVVNKLALDLPLHVHPPIPPGALD